MISGFFDGAITGPISDFVLQWQDGAEWKEIPGSAAKGNHDPFWSCKFQPVTAAKIRLLVTKTRTNTSRIWEVELYGPVAAK